MAKGRQIYGNRAVQTGRLDCGAGWWCTFIMLFVGVVYQKSYHILSYHSWVPSCWRYIYDLFDLLLLLCTPLELIN